MHVVSKLGKGSEPGGTPSLRKERPPPRVLRTGNRWPGRTGVGVAWFPQVPLEDNSGQIIQDNSHLGLCLPERIQGGHPRVAGSLVPRGSMGGLRV